MAVFGSYGAYTPALDYRQLVDLNTVEVVSVPTCRGELWPLGAGDAVLAGGTWLFSEPQPHLRRLVDITALGWQLAGRTDHMQYPRTCSCGVLGHLRLVKPLGRQPVWRYRYVTVTLLLRPSLRLKSLSGSERQTCCRTGGLRHFMGRRPHR